MKLRDIAFILKGELYGDGDIEILAPMDFQRAGQGHITYLAHSQKKGLSCSASAVLVNKRLDISSAQVVVENPKAAFAEILGIFYPKRHPYHGISKRAEIDGDAILGKEVAIAPFAVIGKGAVIGARTVVYPGVFIGPGVRVGGDCVLYNNVSIMDECIVGNRVIIHAGTVIGSDGFGFVFDRGVHKKIPQTGNVHIEDDVEIGANAAIDRAVIGTTIVGRGTKIDNLVQIGHNVSIGANSIVVAQVGIGGSSKIGEGVILAGQAGVSDHAEIDAGTVIGAQSGVTGRLTKNIYVGTPGKPYKQVIKAYDMFHTLPELKRRLEKMEALLGNICSQELKEQ